MLYQPFWCEENIWHLAGDPQVGPGERWVALLTGVAGHFPCWGQRAAATPDAPVLWDYHVILLVHQIGWHVWDLDACRGCPLPATTWLATTFPEPERIHAAFQPRCLMVPASTYRSQLTSDRAHMRHGQGTSKGEWQQPPPPWPLLPPPLQPADGTTLATYIQRARCGLTYDELRARLS